MIKTEFWRLIESAPPWLQGFFTMDGVHFSWMGLVKWVLASAGYTITVDMLGMSGFTANLVVTPAIMWIYWIALHYFMLAGRK